MSAGDAIRKYVSGSGWQTVAPDSGGGGSLPAWWTVDSTPGAESVDFAGAVTISPSDASTVLTGTSLGGDFIEVDGLNFAQFLVSRDGSTDILQAAGATRATLNLLSDTANQPRITMQSGTLPADGAFGSSKLGIWYDATNGAPKVMFKGKTANGTVVTGSVPLS